MIRKPWFKTYKNSQGIKSEESAWLKKYIDLNTKLRTEAKQLKNDFEVDFFKLMCKAVSDKTIEISGIGLIFDYYHHKEKPKNQQLNQTMNDA